MITIEAAITRVLRIINILTPGRGPSDEELTTGLEIFQAMRGQLNIDRLWVYRVNREEFSLVANTGTYTMGPGATFNTDRPVRIDRAGVLIISNSIPPEYPVEVVDSNGWADVTFKTRTSTYPSCLYPDPTRPNITIRVAPVPLEVNTLVLYSWQTLQTFDALNTNIDGPEGYIEALVYQAAKRFAPEWRTQLSRDATQLAEETLAAVQRHNAPPIELEMDPMFAMGGYDSQFDARAGRYR